MSIVPEVYLWLRGQGLSWIAVVIWLCDHFFIALVNNICRLLCFRFFFDTLEMFIEALFSFFLSFIRVSFFFFHYNFLRIIIRIIVIINSGISFRSIWWLKCLFITIKDLFFVLFLLFLLFLLVFIIWVCCTCLSVANLICFSLSKYLSLSIFYFNLWRRFHWRSFSNFIFSFFNWSRLSDVLVKVLKKGFNENSVFLLVLLINTRLVFLCNTSYNFFDCVPVLLHFLVVASTLTGVSGDDHVWHHLVDSSVFLEVLIFQ